MREIERANRVKSLLLISLMGLLLVAAGAGIAFAIEINPWFRLFRFGQPNSESWKIYFVCIAVAIVIWALFTLADVMQGDAKILKETGAVKCPRDQYPAIHNIIEEMSIAAGLPVPPAVYIINDPALNAFSVGRDINRSAIAVTSGLLVKLKRDELQGVIAHEIAHIRNRDVLLAVTASNITHALTWATIDVWNRGDKEHSKIACGLLVWPLWIVLGLAVLSRRMLMRNREYLADASAALFTRYPAGLASALEKFMLSNTRVRLAQRATAYIYAADPFADNSNGQPHLADRVAILRAMGGNASLAAYNQAWGQLHNRTSIVGPASGTMEFPGRPADPESAAGDGPTRTRQISGLFWQLQDYRTIYCECATKMVIPPDFKDPTISCPHCGGIHSLKEAR